PPPLSPPPPPPPPHLPPPPPHLSPPPPPLSPPPPPPPHLSPPSPHLSSPPPPPHLSPPPPPPPPIFRGSSLNEMEKEVLPVKTIETQPPQPSLSFSSLRGEENETFEGISERTKEIQRMLHRQFKAEMEAEKMQMNREMNACILKECSRIEAEYENKIKLDRVRYQDECDTSLKEQKQLMELNKQLRTHVETVEREMTDLRRERDKLEEMHRILGKKYEAVIEEFQEMKEDNKKVKMNLKEISVEHENLKTSQILDKKSSASAQAELQYYYEVANKDSTKKRQLEAQLDDAETKRSNAERVSQELSSDLKELQNRYGIMNKINLQIQSDFESVNREVKRLQKQLMDVNNAHATIVESDKTARKENERLVASENALKMEIISLRQKLTISDKMEHDVLTFKRDAEVYRKELDAFRIENQALRNEINFYCDSINKMKAEMKLTDNDLLSSRQEAHQLKKQMLSEFRKEDDLLAATDPRFTASMSGSRLSPLQYTNEGMPSLNTASVMNPLNIPPSYSRGKEGEEFCYSPQVFSNSVGKIIEKGDARDII
ncbi:putative Myosin-2 heavy chain, non muscle, partial [Cardiosporidium cionae]